MPVNRSPAVLSGRSGTEGRAQAGREVNGLSGWAPFAVASSALFVLLAGSNLPTPLFPLYAKVYGLSPLMVTLLFATYALLVIPALLVFGPLSDAKGRRELLIPAIILAGLAAGLFAAARDVMVLFAAQAVQAMALGALQGTGAATLIENDPSGQRRRASAIASGLTVGGAAVGPLLAGLLAQYAALALRLAYLIEVGLLAVVLIAVTAKLPGKQRRERWRPRRPALPAGIRRPFAIAAVSVFVAWGVAGLFLSLIPSFVTMTLKGSLALAGAVVALMLGTSMAVQLAGYRLESLRAQTAGLAVMIAGLAALIAADTTRVLALMLMATMLAGAGHGLAFMGSLGDVSHIAPSGRRGDIVASYYVVVYVGTAIPVIGVGVLTEIVGFGTAIQVFGYVMVAICLGGLAALVSELHIRRRSRQT